MAKKVERFGGRRLIVCWTFGLSARSDMQTFHVFQAQAELLGTGGEKGRFVNGAGLPKGGQSKVHIHCMGACLRVHSEPADCGTHFSLAQQWHVQPPRVRIMP